MSGKKKPQTLGGFVADNAMEIGRRRARMEMAEEYLRGAFKKMRTGSAPKYLVERAILLLAKGGDE